MSTFRKLRDRNADQQRAREHRAALARRLITQPLGPARTPKKKTKAEASPSVIQRVEAPSEPHQPWTSVRAGCAKIELSSRVTDAEVRPHSWTDELVNGLLDAAASDQLRLSLVWPAKVDSMPLIHALANIERLFARDLFGLRTVLFPGTHATKSSLQGVSINRAQLSDLYQSCWEDVSGRDTRFCVERPSTSFQAVLNALNDVRLRHPELPNPSMAETIPTFIFDGAGEDWKTTAATPLERTLSKVGNITNRRALRERVLGEWANAEDAPCALMVLHNSTRKEGWRRALTARALMDAGRPEALLFDATKVAMRSNYQAVKRIPELWEFAREKAGLKCGGLIVTDDPRTFFSLRARLGEMKLPVSASVVATELATSLVSVSTSRSGHAIATRSNSNFSVNIVDRDASDVALAFHRLAQTAGIEATDAHQSLIDAALYVLRISSVPSGYVDLVAQSTDEINSDSAVHRQTWVGIRDRLDAALGSGVLNTCRTQVTTAMTKAESLIDDWSDATPMAARFLSEVQDLTHDGKRTVIVVLPNSSYIQLAHRFVQRKLGEKWALLERTVRWETLSTIGETLNSIGAKTQLLFIGVGDDAMRILVAHPNVPHRTVVLAPYRQAETAFTTLTAMMKVESLKPFKGRMGLLANELDRRLKDFPNPAAIRRLSDLRGSFWSDAILIHAGQADQSLYRFTLDGGERMYSSGYVYLHVPDEDPFFRRVAANGVKAGDMILNLSDDLKGDVERALNADNGGVGERSIVDPVRFWVAMFHDRVRGQCQLLFPALRRMELARKILARMIELDSTANACRVERVCYWLGIDEADNRPHASKNKSYFQLFCRALDIPSDEAEQQWTVVRNARRLNQYLGRELSARYAEVLFQPESARIYRKVRLDVIQRLREDALHCVRRIESIHPPIRNN